MARFLAFDLGAESGRAILGSFADRRLTIEELHRFPNQPVRLPDGLYWDSFRLFHEITEGLRVAGRDRQVKLDGMGVDTWGVDYGLLGADDALLENPRCYRDARTQGMFDRTFAVVPKAEVFRQTGIQFMELNSLYQLHASALAHAPALPHATRLLFMPDLLAHWLGGRPANELTIASTSQCYNPREQRWATEMLEQLGIPPRLFGEVVEPGTRLGSLLPHLQDASGCQDVPIYATAGHDTAAAVAAVPAEGDNWCYISSGTWSLMGVEVDQPVINDESLALNFTNELGAGGKVRLLKNIMGLWILQECRRDWLRQGREFSYEELMHLANAARPNIAVLDTEQFFAPGHMPERIQQHCRATGQQVPETPGEIARVVLESLAHAYKHVAESLERLTGKPIRTIHIIGGGGKNQLLNQLTAEITGRRVVVGPVEATAIGNILVQAIGAGLLSGLDEARQIVRNSFAVSAAA